MAVLFFVMCGIQRKMLTILLIVTFHTACICYVNGQSPCTTPSGAKGTCKNILVCQELLDLHMKREKPDFVRASYCGLINKQHHVCCPDPCMTVEGNPGKCISIYSCPHLQAKLVAPVSQENIEYLKNSRCKSSEPLGVCCGPQEYSNNCNITLTSYPPDPHSKCCGEEINGSNRIMGGTRTAIDQYPWLALLEYNWRGQIVTFCGGTLISAKYVLTAAHCMSEDQTSIGTPVNVRLGEYNTSSTNPDCMPVEANGNDCNYDLVVIPIAQTIQHPGFVDAKKGNDIALVRMQRMAPFTDFIRPICLPSVDRTLPSPDNFTLVAAGWGATSTHANSEVKMHVELPFITLESCLSSYKSSFNLGSKQMCAGGVLGKDTCKGDSGGPLMLKTGKTYELIGVVSFGPTPCGQQIPGVYTKVYEYKDWILNNIRP